MFEVVDQWDCVVKTCETREDAEAYIAMRMQAYRGKVVIAPVWMIREK